VDVNGNIRWGTRTPEYLFYPQFTGMCPQNENIGLIIETMAATLSENLAAANARSVELDLEVSKRELAVREASVETVRAQNIWTAEQETALIAGRDPNEALLRTAQATSKKLEIAREKYAVARGAHVRQRGDIEAIQHEITANRREKFMRDSAGMRQELFSMAHQFAEKAATLEALAMEGGIDQHQLADALLPLVNLGEPDSNSTHRDNYFNTVNAALRLFANKWAWRKVPV
jgi:hypothetical protein